MTVGFTDQICIDLELNSLSLSDVCANGYCCIAIFDQIVVKHWHVYTNRCENNSFLFTVG